MRRKRRKPTKPHLRKNAKFYEFFTDFKQKYGNNAPFWALLPAVQSTVGTVTYPRHTIITQEPSQNNALYQPLHHPNHKIASLLGLINGFEYGNPYLYPARVPFSLDKVNFWYKRNTIPTSELMKYENIEEFSQKLLAGWFVRVVKKSGSMIRPRFVLGAFSRHTDDICKICTKTEVIYGYDGQYGYLCRVFRGHRGKYLAIIQMAATYFNVVWRGMNLWIVYDLQLVGFETAKHRDIKRSAYGYANSVYEAKLMLERYFM